MKRLFRIAALLLPALAAAQAPDEEAIFDRTTQASSPYYYPNLLIRYNAGDTTLTVDDYRYLTYGNAFRDEYKPLSTNDDLDRTLLVAARLDPDKPAARTSKPSSCRARPPSNGNPSARSRST